MRISRRFAVPLSACMLLGAVGVSAEVFNGPSRARADGCTPFTIIEQVTAQEPYRSEPGGVTFRELAQFIYSLEGLNVVAMDVMEVSPEVDPSNITAAAAAKLVREAILLFGD